MHSLRVSSLSFFAFAAAWGLAACGASSPANPAQGSPMAPAAAGPRTAGWLSPDGESSGYVPRIYASDYDDSVVRIFREADGKSLGEITDGVDAPWGLFIDSQGTLYVVNAGNNTVNAYPRNSTEPSATWSQDLSSPRYVVVDAGGDLFVSNGNGNGTVVEFPAGSTTASAVLQTPGVEADGMGFDSEGNLYVAYRTQQNAAGGSIEEFAPGSTVGTSLGMTLDQPQGLIVDGDGGINVVETGGTQSVAHFPAGKTKPTQVVTDTTSRQSIFQLALDRKTSELYIAANMPNTGQVLTLLSPFTTSSSLEQLLSVDKDHWLTGIALTNGQTF
jgi:hypothetical protein